MRPDQTTAAKHHPGSWRAVLLALAAVACFAWITPYNDYDLQNTYVAGNLFPMGAMVAVLALVLLVNPVLRRVAPRWVFRPHEIGLVWGVIAIASGIPAAGLLRYLLPAQTSLWYYATPENHWADQMLPHLKPWLAPRAEAVAVTFYKGSPGAVVPWSAWRPSLTMWFIAAAQVFFACGCLTVLLRRQWVERERFSFPLVQLPMSLAAPPDGEQAFNAFLRNRLVWCGAAVPILVHGVNGLHLYFPGVPQIDLHYNLAQHIPNVWPWNAAGWTGLNAHVFPATIGFAYLLAQEIAFSMWFFRVFEVLQRVFLVWSNLLVSGNDIRNFTAHQAYGAVLALAVMVFLLARPHFGEVWARVRGRSGGADDRDEALSYRLALWGLVAAVLGLAATFVQFGVAPLLTITVVLVGLAMYVAASWGAANAGLMMVQTAFRPGDLVISALGSRHFTPASLVNLGLVENVFWFDIREALMPSLLNAVRLAQDTGLRQRSVFRVGAVAIVLATGVATVAWLNLCYDRGGTQLAPGTFLWHAGRVWREVMARLDPGEPARTVHVAGAGLGAALFFALITLRLRFVGWPLHPIGLVTIYSWTSNQFWLSFLIGWLLKGLVIRIGGLRLYAQWRPFFLGVILGDVTIAAVMTVIGFIYGQGYFVTPS